MDQSPAWLVEDRSTIILLANVCVEEQEQEDGKEIKDGHLIQRRHNDISMDAHLIMNPKKLARESWIESKKMNGYFRPCDFQQYSPEAIIQAFVGHVGTVELAIVAIEC